MLTGSSYINLEQTTKLEIDRGDTTQGLPTRENNDSIHIRLFIFRRNDHNQFSEPNFVSIKSWMGNEKLQLQTLATGEGQITTVYRRPRWLILKHCLPSVPVTRRAMGQMETS